MNFFEFLREYIQREPVYDVNGNIVEYTAGLPEGLTDLVLAAIFAVFLIIVTIIVLFIVKKIIYARMRRKVKKIEEAQKKREILGDKKRKNLKDLADELEDSPYAYVDVSKRAKTLTQTLYRIIATVVWIIIIIIILGSFKINVVPFITGAGIVGIAIAFGAQEFIKDFISGMFNIFENTYSVDEKVEINGFTGYVREIGLRTTKIEDWKGDFMIVNNGQITSVFNFSRNTSVAEVQVQVSNANNPEEVLALLKEFAENYQTDNPNYIGPVEIYGMSNADKNSFEFSMGTTVMPGENPKASRDLRLAAVKYLADHGIKAPVYSVEQVKK